MKFNVKLSPVARLTGAGTIEPLALEKAGSTIKINGTSFDLSVIPDGATLPDAAEATGCEYFVGGIDSVDGDYHMTILLPHSDRPTHEQAFPEPIVVDQDGPIALPTDAPGLDGKTAQEIYDEHN